MGSLQYQLFEERLRVLPVGFLPSGPRRHSLESAFCLARPRAEAGFPLSSASARHNVLLRPYLRIVRCMGETTEGVPDQ